MPPFVHEHEKSKQGALYYLKYVIIVIIDWHRGIFIVLVFQNPGFKSLLPG